jgi:hypothetical protein
MQVSTMKDKTTQQILAGEMQTQLASILAKARQLRVLTQQLRALLPAEIAANCQVANIQQGCLVISASSAAWLTQLRFLHYTLLRQFQTHAALANYTTIRWLVQPIATPSTPRITNTLSMSSDSASSLTAIAQTIQHTGLRHAMQRLARHAITRDNAIEEL